MLRLIGQVFQHTLVGCCLSVMSLLFFGMTSLLRCLPRLFGWLVLGLRGLLILSVHLYDLLLGSLNPFSSALGIDLRSGVLRWLACILISSLLGLILITLLGWLDWIWLLAIFDLHGLFTDLVWDSVMQDDDLFLGARL